MADEGRVFLRGISSETYGLAEFRKRQRAAPRVRKAGTVTDDASIAHSGDSDQSRTWWLLGPGDDPFLTQTLQMHFVELYPGGSNKGHGHQNEALFYIMEGTGYEIHDGKRYDWAKDDLVVVHCDSVHRHYNASKTERALALVMKAKSQWMYLGLIQQGRGGPEDPQRFGAPRDWSALWTPGVEQKKKVVKPADAPWRDDPDGRVRVLSAPERTDVRAHSVDVSQHELRPGGRSDRYWHMADEATYVMSGRGHSLQWDVAAEIGEKYEARIANEPSRWDFTAGDLVYTPQNTVHQYVNDDPANPLVMLTAKNRVFTLLGYDNIVRLEEASTPQRSVAAATR